MGERGLKKFLKDKKAPMKCLNRFISWKKILNNFLSKTLTFAETSQFDTFNIFCKKENKKFFLERKK